MKELWITNPQDENQPLRGVQLTQDEFREIARQARLECKDSGYINLDLAIEQRLFGSCLSDSERKLQG